MANTAIVSIPTAKEHPLQIDGIQALICSFLNPGEETCQAAQISSAWVDARSSLTCAELIARLGREKLKSFETVAAYLNGCRLIYPFLRNFYFGNVLHLVKDRTIALNITACLPLLKLERISMGDLPLTCFDMLSQTLRASIWKLQQLALPFPPANQHRIGNMRFPHISSARLTKLEFVLRGIVGRRQMEEIAENFPALESLTIIGDPTAKGAKLDICGLLLKLPFLRSLEFCQMGFAPALKASSEMSHLEAIPPHAFLKHIRFTDCYVDAESVKKFLEKIPNLNSITYKDCIP